MRFIQSDHQCICSVLSLDGSKTKTNSSHCYLLLLKVHSWSLLMTQACLACYHLVGSYLLNSFQYNCWGLHRECAPGWRLGQDVWHCVKREVQVVSLTNDPSLLKGTCTEDSVHEWHKTAFALYSQSTLQKENHFLPHHVWKRLLNNFNRSRLMLLDSCFLVPLTHMRHHCIGKLVASNICSGIWWLWCS